MKKLKSMIATLALAIALLSVNVPANAQGPVEAGQDTTIDGGQSDAPVDAPVEAPVEATTAPVDGVAADNSTPDAAVDAPVEQGGEAIDDVGGLSGLQEAVDAAQIDDSQAANTYTTNTMFAAQNPGTADASVSLAIYDTSGAQVLNDSQTIKTGRAYVLDQAKQSLANNFQGAAVLSSDAELAVTTLIKGVSTSGTARYDTYNGFASGNVGTKVIVPQFMKDTVSLGDTYNSLLSIQNTGTAVANVTVAYNAGPWGKSATKNLTIPVNGVSYIKSEELSELGDTGTARPGQFFGYVIVTSDQPVAAVATVQSGEKAATKGSLQTFAGVVSSLTPASGEVFGGQMYKAIKSGVDAKGKSCIYASALSIVNVGTGTAKVTVKYYPSSGIPAQFAGGTPFSYNLDITDAAGADKGFKSLDQRYDTNITTPTFYGGISLQVTAGEIVATSNQRASECDRLQTNSVIVSANSGSKVVAPMVFKYDKATISTDNNSWSTAIGIQNLGSTATDVKVTYYPFDANAASITYNLTGAKAIPANGGSINLDQRYDLGAGTSAVLSDGFNGTVVIESLTAGNKIRGAVNVRGLEGPDGDPYTAYSLVTFN